MLNRPLRGVKVTRSGDGFAYTPFEVAKRIFDAPKMNLYPIPQAEIVKSAGYSTRIRVGRPKNIEL